MSFRGVYNNHVQNHAGCCTDTHKLCKGAFNIPSGCPQSPLLHIIQQQVEDSVIIQSHEDCNNWKLNTESTCQFSHN